MQDKTTVHYHTKPLSSHPYTQGKKRYRIPDNKVNLWSADKRKREKLGGTISGMRSVTVEDEDYGDEENFIKTVEDDILENKYSSDGERL